MGAKKTATRPKQARSHPMISITLPVWGHEKLERLMKAWGESKSGAILRLIAEAKD